MQRKLVSFDWAIKKILQHEENFEVLEVFLNELLAKEQAKVVLNYEVMSKQDKIAYNRHIHNQRIKMNVMSTAEEEGKRLRSIEVAKTLLLEHIAPHIIAKSTQLTLAEIERIARGEDIMENYI